MGPTGVSLLDLLEFLGDVGFAVSGALAAAGRRLDVGVLCVAALASGLAGGTLRDLLIGAPVFWLDRPLVLAACVIAAGAVSALGERPWTARALLWFDAVGLSAVALVGVARAASVGVTPLAAAVTGVLAAAAGGLVRDGFARRAVVLLGRELYLAAAIAGVVLFVVLRLLQVDAGLAAAAGFLAALALRAGALRFGWSLPGPTAD